MKNRWWRGNVCEDGGAIAFQITSFNLFQRIANEHVHDTMFLEGIQHPVVILMGKMLFQGLAVTKSARESVSHLADHRRLIINPRVVCLADS